MSNIYITPYSRKGLSNCLTDEDNLNGAECIGKCRGTISVSLELSDGSEEGDKKENAAQSGKTENRKSPEAPYVSRTMEMYGPSDILAINESAIRNIVPDPHAGAMSYCYMPYIEFYEPDFPWRYTPLKASNNKLRPWITLVVCMDGEFKMTNRNGRTYVEILSEEALPDTDKLYLTGHVHNVDGSEAEGNLSFSRLICLRQLNMQTKYTAFLIPSFEQGRQQKYEGIDIQSSAWTKTGNGNKANGEFPLYYSWEFTTGNANFKILSQKMSAISTEEASYKELKDILNIDITSTGLNMSPDLMRIEADSVYKVKDSALGKSKLSALLSWTAADKIEKNGKYDKKENPVIPITPYSNEEIVKDSVIGRYKLAALIEKMQQQACPDDKYGIMPISVALTKYDREVPEPTSETLSLIQCQQKELKSLLSRNPVFIENEVTKGADASLLDEEDPWVVPPVYGARQFLSDKTDLDKDTLTRELNLDFENRIAAGLGATVVQDNQEELVNQAWQQIETVNKQNQIIRELVQMDQLNRISGRRISDRIGTALGKSKALRSDSAVRVGSHYRHLDTNPVISILSQNQQRDVQTHIDSETKVAVSKSSFPNEQAISRKDLETLFSNKFLSDNKEKLSHCLVANKLTADNFWNIYPELNILNSYLRKDKEGDTIKPTIIWFGETEVKSYTNLMPHSVHQAYSRLCDEKCFANLLDIFSDITALSILREFLQKANFLDSYLSACHRNYSCLRVRVNDAFGVFVGEETYNQLPGAERTWCTKISGFYYQDKQQDFYIFNLNHPNAAKGGKIEFYMGDNKLYLESEKVGEGVNAFHFKSERKGLEGLNIDSKINALRKNSEDTLEKTVLNDAIADYDYIIGHQWYPTYVKVADTSDCNHLEYDFSYSDYDGFKTKAVKEMADALKEIDELNKEAEQNIEADNAAAPEDPATQTSYASEHAREKLADILGKYYQNRDVDLSDYAFSTYPIMKEPEFPNPAFFYLRELSQKFILPSVDAIRNNSIVCFQSNPKFEEAFLSGMNTEMGRELLWREYPTDKRGSYFRKFWDKDKLPERFDESYFDIKRMDKWNSKLGNNHMADNKLLIIVIKAELMRAYPETLVNISYFQNGAFETQNVLDPEISGWLNDDTYFVGFYENLVKGYCTEDASKTYCLLFHEQLANQRFNHLDNTNFATSAEFAVKSSVRPTVFGYPLFSIKNIQQ